jgi:hypothetical protein
MGSEGALCPGAWSRAPEEDNAKLIRPGDNAKLICPGDKRKTYLSRGQTQNLFVQGTTQNLFCPGERGNLPGGQEGKTDVRPQKDDEADHLGSRPGP